ncbi:MAG TPA: hypothetical protein VN193_11185 [Candidatus Angelobacter sp.]|nr:hypothetical protein [Candidatus Angelobacter sp.]
MVARLGLAMTIAGAGLVLVGPPLVGHAEVGGAGCTAHIAGVDVANVNSQDQNTAIHVQKTDSIRLDLAGEPGQTGVHVDYNVAGGASIGKDGSGTSYSATVGDYANVTGLYLVRGTSKPSAACTAAALVQVDGNPLSSPIGDAAAGLTAVGGAMVLAGGALAAGQSGGESDVSASMGGGESQSLYDQGQLTQFDNRVIMRAGQDDPGDASWQKQLGKMKNTGFCGAALPMALVMTTMVMMGAVPTVGVPQQRLQVPRARWRPRLSVLGILGGLLGSLGSVVLMELNGTVYPTRRWTVEALAGGLLVGLIVPSLGNAIAAWRINRRRAARFALLQQQPTAATVAAAWTATHRVPSGGMPSWPAPDPAAEPGPNLDPGLDVQVVEDRGDWARVVCDNGWSCWIDGRRLEPLS